VFQIPDRLFIFCKVLLWFDVGHGH
jgi:hypothetical protein